jgi:very-short-patch-repair endonuclease
MAGPAFQSFTLLVLALAVTPGVHAISDSTPPQACALQFDENRGAGTRAVVGDLADPASSQDEVATEVAKRAPISNSKWNTIKQAQTVSRLAGALAAIDMELFKFESDQRVVLNETVVRVLAKPFAALDLESLFAALLLSSNGDYRWISDQAMSALQSAYQQTKRTMRIHGLVEALRFFHRTRDLTAEVYEDWELLAGGRLHEADLRYLTYLIEELRDFEMPISEVFIERWFRAYETYFRGLSAPRHERYVPVALAILSLARIHPPMLDRIVPTIKALARPPDFLPVRARHAIFRTLAYLRHVLQRPDVPEISVGPVWEGRVTPFQLRLANRLRSRGYHDLQVEASIVATHSRVDVFLPSKKVVIELDGPQHYEMDRQGRVRLRTSDEIRDDILNSLGLTVIRFTNDAFRESSDEILEAIVREIGEP